MNDNIKSFKDIPPREPEGYRNLLSLLNEAAYAAYRKAPSEDRDVLISMLKTTDRLVDDLD